MTQLPYERSNKGTSEVIGADDPRSINAFRKNEKRKCIVCRALPTVGDTGLCGPCCFGEAETVNGNW